MKSNRNCAEILTHLSRIQGQIEGLKGAIEKGESCEKIAVQASSILRSFGSVRSRIIEATLLQEVLQGKSLSPEKSKKLSQIISLYKS